jgi:hypothetical protein
MEFIYRPQEYLPETREDYADYAFKPTLLDAMGAVGEITKDTNPSGAISRMLEKEDEKSPLLSPEDAQKKYFKPGMGYRFEQPIRESTAQRIYERHISEMQNQAIVQSGPQGFWPEVAKFGSGLAYSAVDPINILSGFVPTAAAAKAAKLIRGSKISTAGAITGAELFGAKVINAVPKGSIGQAALVGAAEGIAGAALVEPIVSADAQRDMMDYDAYDSLTNIAFGGILGGGLHSAARHFELRSERIVGQKLNEAIKLFEEKGATALSATQAELVSRSQYYKDASINRASSELSQAIDSLNLSQRANLFRSAFLDAMLDRVPKNIDAQFQRMFLANQPNGLNEFTFRIDGSLSLENQGRLKSRSNGEPTAAIPQAVFKNRKGADDFIRAQGDRSGFITQRMDNGSFTVLSIKPASIVRDTPFTGPTKFKSYEEAAKRAKEIGNAQPVNFVKERGKSGQDFVVIRGITPEEAQRLTVDSSYAEFYEPRPEMGKVDTVNKLSENSISLKPMASYDKVKDDLFNYEKLMEVDDDLLTEASIDTVEQAKKSADDFVAQIKERYPDLHEDYMKILDSVDEEIDNVETEATAYKMISNCFIRRA